MFTTPCFIRKNTPELRKQLEELGYLPPSKMRYDKNFAICTILRDNVGEYVVFKIDDDFENVIKPSYPYIDCGTNEELFFALAALRDDSDKEQWFITYKSSHPYMDYAAILCREDKWEDEYVKESQQHNFIDTKPEDYHKANVKEIIRLYKDFEEDLKDLYKYDED